MISKGTDDILKEPSILTVFASVGVHSLPFLFLVVVSESG